MKKFSYVITDRIGKKQKGELYAPTQESALQELKEKGLLVLKLEESKEEKLPFWKKPSLAFQDKLLMASHLATMVGAGLTLTEALKILLEQTTAPNNRAMYEDMIHRINAGQTLSDALMQYPNVFSSIFINMVAVGEKSGSLQDVLGYLEQQLEKEYDLRQKVVGAMIYPAVIVGLTLFMVFAIVFFIMPKILKIFEAFDVGLPLPTRILIGFTHLLTDSPLLVFGGMFSVLGLMAFLWTLPKVKELLYVVSLRLPVFGKLLISVSMARLGRSLNSLLKAGVPINKALDITSSLFSNHVYADIFSLARERVEKGSSLEDALSGNLRLVPILVVKMLAVGEKTGNLEETTSHVARLYEQRVDGITRNLSTLIEPILLVFMGALVGGVALSVILPIYQLPNLIH